MNTIVDNNPGPVFIIEDDAGLLHLIEKILCRSGYRVQGFADGNAAVSEIMKSPPVLMLLDYQLKQITAATIIKTLSENRCLPPFIIMTGHGNETIAVEMMKLGALDYIVKDGAFLDLLPSIVERSIHNLTMEQKYIEAEKHRKRLESQLAQSRKMEAIGTLAGGIAHDFNNILSSILGYAELVKDDLPGPSVVKDNIEQVLKASLRAKELVRRILTFSRMAEPNHAPVSVKDVVSEVLTLLRASIPSSIRIESTLGEKDCFIRGNSNQIHQVVINLCTNAAQSMEGQGGIITITLSQVKFRPDPLPEKELPSQDDYVELCISDTGTGIDPEHMDKIFDPYFTTRNIGEGSGMGLAIVHGIVQNHHGVIQVESLLDKGTRFRVLLPEIHHDFEKQMVKSECLPAGRECILVVDDEKAVLEMNRIRLERLKFQVTALTDSQKALALFENEPNTFDLVITDQTMPDMNGIQLSRRILDIRPDIPIILCTGYDPDMNAQEIRDSGIREFLMKPFSRDELVQTISRVLEYSNKSKRL